MCFEMSAMCHNAEDWGNRQRYVSHRSRGGRRRRRKAEMHANRRRTDSEYAECLDWQR